MKRKFIAIFSIFMATAITLGSCADNKKEAPKSAPKTTTKAAGNLPNYRYVDTDSVLAKYNLAKDFDEEMLRMQNNLDNETRRHEGEIRKFQNSMQAKINNNTYTEASYKADQQKLNQMGNTAQQSVGKLQEAMAKAGIDAQKALQDSLQAFIKDYNASHGYDAILIKSATLYIDPRLDITDEVIEGLNARYNKVKK